jgi:hypothetical protein
MLHRRAAAGKKNGQSDQNRNFDVTLLATKSPRHQEYIEILSSCFVLSGKAVKFNVVS